MNRNDYRRALIMLRSLKGGASGYVRLERRTLSATLRFTLNSAPSGGELYAVLLCRRNGAWHAVKADAFGAPRYGQVGLVWSFDPRNIEGLTLEQYDMAAVAQVSGGSCELVLCGNLNGSVNADFDCTELNTAVSRLFTAVRVSRPYQPAQLSVGQDIPAIDAPDAAAAENSSDLDARQSTDADSASADEKSDVPQTENALRADADFARMPQDMASADEDSDSIKAVPLPDLAQENDVPCGCGASDADIGFEEGPAQAALSDSVYSPETAKSAVPDAAQNGVPVKSNEFDAPAAPIESDEFVTPAQMPIQSDDLDTPAQMPDSDTSSAAPLSPASSDADEFSDPVQAVLSNSVYSPEKAESAASDTERDVSPVEADEFDTPAQTPAEKDDLDIPALTIIEADDFDTPAQTPIESDDLDTPAQTPIESDDLDTPAQTSIESDDLDTPAAGSAEQRDLSAAAKHSSIDSELSLQSESSRGTETEDSPPPSAGQQLALADPDAAWHRSIEPLRRLFFSQEAVVPFESDGYVFIRVPLYGIENTSSCLAGLYCEDGVPSRVCYAIPADHTAEPPAGLENYVWRGSRTRGYWVTCEAVPAAQ